MTKIGSKIFDKTEGIKPRERVDITQPRIKTTPGLFLDTQHRAAKLEAENAALRNHSVKIVELEIVPGRKRRLTDQEFHELKSNLDAFPLINPIAIRALPSGKYELISGHNRVQAYLELGRQEIDANIIELGEEQLLPAAFYSNLLSPSLPDYEKYLGFKQLQQATGKSQSELAKESGLSKSMVSMLFAFDELPPATHDLLSQNPHSVSATLVSKIKNLPLAPEALHRLASGEINAQQALTEAAHKSPLVGSQNSNHSIVIKSGKRRVASIVTRGSTIGIRLADENLTFEILDKVENLIRAHFTAKPQDN